MSSTTTDALAINGGTPVRTQPWPARRLFGEEEKQAAIAMFDECIKTGGVIGYNGAEEEAYCKEFAAFHGGGFADGVNSGTSAIFGALKALNLQPFTEVIVPPISDPGGIMPVALMNCIPIPCDSTRENYNIDPQDIERRITPRTSAIIAAHISGMPADMDPIMAIGRKHGVPVIEDCAQAHGATYKGKLVGTLGDIAAFSTMSGKHHATGPQGGVVFTHDEATYWRSRQGTDRGKPFGIENAAGNVVASHNLNSNDLSAAIGRVQLKKLPWIVESRQKCAAAIARGCEQLEAIKLNTGLPNTRSAYWFMMVKLDLAKLNVDKATFVNALNAEGIPASPSYWCVPMLQPWATEQKVFGDSGYPWAAAEYRGKVDTNWFPHNAKAVQDSHFIMGMHERMGDQEATDIVAAFAKLEAAFLK